MSTLSQPSAAYAGSAVAATPYDVAAVRADFPILTRLVRGHPLVYLDNAATSQKPRQVIDAIVRYYETSNANVHRGIHQLAEEATTAYEAARVRVAGFVGAPAPECVIFTRGTTEAINLVAASWGRATLNPGDQIILTAMEHHSNLVPWQLIAQQTGAVLAAVPVTPAGTLDLEVYAQLLAARPTKLVACVHKSNVLGTINPIREMAVMAHAAGALLLADGAQSAPHLEVDFASLGCDFYTLSGHKLCGPTGIGALVARRHLLECMPPYHGGGEMIRRVKLDSSTYADVPHKFEAGTPNIEGAIAMAAAMDYLDGIGRPAIHEHEVALTRYAMERMSELPWITIYGSPDPAARAGVVTFNDDEVHPHDLSTLLDSRGVAVRAGHHCAQPLMEHLGVVATTRASFYLYNTLAEVDTFIGALRFTHEYFHGRR